MSKMNWNRAKKPRDTEPAFKPVKKPAKGGWTHVKRQPVRHYTAEEIARYEAERGDL